MNTAVFVDFEDLHRVLGRAHGSDPARAASSREARDQALEIIGQVLKRLRREGSAMVIGRSYAAFDTQPGSEVAHDLALLGLEPRYVLFDGEGRGSSDVQLTLDVAKVLFRRADIERIVVVSGSQEFLPLAREVLEEGRELLMVSVGRATSGDLVERIGGQRFLDASELLGSSGPLASNPGGAAAHAEAGQAAERPDGASEPTGPSSDLRSSSTGTGAGSGPADGDVTDRGRENGEAESRAVVLGRIPVTWTGNHSPSDRRSLLIACMELMLRARQRHGSDEIWLSPFLKGPMSQAFAHIVHPERRALINELRTEGAIRVEERENLYAQHPYSVIVVVDQHPLVQDAANRMGRESDH